MANSEKASADIGPSNRHPQDSPDQILIYTYRIGSECDQYGEKYSRRALWFSSFGGMCWNVGDMPFRSA
jgi:hypothetical protein